MQGDALGKGVDPGCLGPILLEPNPQVLSATT